VDAQAQPLGGRPERRLQGRGVGLPLHHHHHREGAGEADHGGLGQVAAGLV